MSLIVLEGLDGSGKGTQTQLLFEELSQRGKPVRKVTFPDYQSPSSSLVKMYLNGEFGAQPGDVNAYAASAFYAVDRFASFRRAWKADYDGGTLILCDRYATSNMVYQMGKLPRAEWDGYLAWMEDFEYQKLGIPRPDLVLYLDMPIEVSQKLLLQRYQGDSGKKDIHESHLAFLRSCGECARYAGQRLGWKVVSCAKGGEPLPVEEIHRAVLAAVEPLLEKPGEERALWTGRTESARWCKRPCGRASALAACLPWSSAIATGTRWGGPLSTACSAGCM